MHGYYQYNGTKGRLLALAQRVRPLRKEGSHMDYVTWQELFLFLTFLLAFAEYFRRKK